MSVSCQQTTHPKPDNSKAIGVPRASASRAHGTAGGGGRAAVPHGRCARASHVAAPVPEAVEHAGR